MELYKSDKDSEIVYDYLKKVLNKKKIKIFSEIDHSHEAKKSNLELSFAKLIIFGDPKVGTLLMQEDIKIAIDLPLKILIWEEKGVCNIGFYKISEIVKQKNHQINNKDIMNKIDCLIESIIKEII
jgi:uncharacterized protein (DUF302 family)